MKHVTAALATGIVASQLISLNAALDSRIEKYQNSEAHALAAKAIKTKAQNYPLRGTAGFPTTIEQAIQEYNTPSFADIDGSNLKNTTVAFENNGRRIANGIIADVDSIEYGDVSGQMVYFLTTYHTMESAARNTFTTSKTPDEGIKARIGDHQVRLTNKAALQLDEGYWCLEPRWDLALYRGFSNPDQNGTISNINLQYPRVSIGDSVTIVRHHTDNLPTKIIGTVAYQKVNVNTTKDPEHIQLERIFKTDQQDTKAGDSGSYVEKDNKLVGLVSFGSPSEEEELARKNPGITRGRNVMKFLEKCFGESI